MNYCPNCRNFKQSDEVCEDCGTNLLKESTKICSKCGATNRIDLEKCNNCKNDFDIKADYESNKPVKQEKMEIKSEDFSIESKVSTQGTVQLNKVVNVTLVGGIIGLIGVRPNNALNSRIKKENVNGWKVIQIIPSSSGNMLLSILRVILLIVTLFLYTTADGYYVIMERIEKE